MGFTIYCHTNIVTQKRYVGLTKQTLEQRWVAHQSAARRNRGGYFASAIAKYGAASFTSDVLEVVDTRAAANEAERWWIAHFGSDDPAIGYNLTNGGDSHDVSATSRAKIIATMMATTTPEIRSARAKAAGAAGLAARTAESRAMAAEASRATWAAKPDAEKARLAGISKARYSALGAEERARIADQLHGPETRAKKSIIGRQWWSLKSDEEKAAHAAKSTNRSFEDRSIAATKAWETRRAQRGGTYVVADETRAKMSASILANNDPAVRRANAARAGELGRAAQTQDSRKRAAESIRARWASKTPEERVEFAKKISAGHARRKAAQAGNDS